MRLGNFPSLSSSHLLVRLSPVNSAHSHSRDESLFMLAYLERILGEPSPSQAELRAAVFSAMHVCGAVMIQLLAGWSEVEGLDRAGEQVRNTIEQLEDKILKYGRRVGGGRSGGSRRQQREKDLDAAASALNRLYNDCNRLSPTLDDIASMKRDSPRESRKIDSELTKSCRPLNRPAISAPSETTDMSSCTSSPFAFANSENNLSCLSVKMNACHQSRRLCSLPCGVHQDSRPNSASSVDVRRGVQRGCMPRESCPAACVQVEAR